MTRFALMTGWLAVIGMTACRPPARQAPGPDPRVELPRITRELLAAVATGDREIWDRHLAEDGLFTDERGVTRTKADLLEELRPLPTGYQGKLEPRDVVVHAFGDTAVMRFRAEEHLTLFGQTIEDTYFQTNTYQLRDGRWQLIASHVQAEVGDPLRANVGSEVLDRVAGVYQLAPDVRMRIRVSDDHLVMERDGRPPQQLLPETSEVFFTPGGWDARWIVQPDAERRVERLLARRRGEDLVWTRVTEVGTRP
ncbi:MAG: DUF4440 domain-containing protein [Luteitalea sp.]|nr:DUF4440 domain-containing protein [Luteitalea sp.]